jgi:membrane protease YdiL (CAAX protease family)
MRLNTLFINLEQRRMRALWRILLQVVIMAVIVGLPVVGFSAGMTWLWKSGHIPVAQELFDKLMDMVVGLMVTGLVLVSLSAAGKWLDHRRFVDFGFRINPAWWRQYAFGFLLATVLMTGIFLIERVCGWVEIIGYGYISTSALPVWLALLYPLVKALCVGTYEEAFHRGYQVTNLEEGFRGVRGLGGRGAFIPAILISSAIFGLVHLLNPRAGLLSVIVISVIGAMFGLAYVKTGQLAMPMGLHAAWNLSQGVMFGFPVSGDPEIAAIIHLKWGGPRWLTGGDFGPEAGLLGLGAAVLGIVLLLRSGVAIKKPVDHID